MGHAEGRNDKPSPLVIAQVRDDINKMYYINQTHTYKELSLVLKEAYREYQIVCR